MLTGKAIEDAHHTINFQLRPLKRNKPEEKGRGETQE